MRVGLGRGRAWLWLVCGALAFACGEDRTFNDGSGSEAGQGGEGTSGSSTGDGGSDLGEAGSSSGGTSGTGGEVSEAGAGGMPPEPTAECPDGYEEWLSASFAVPDGDVIGTADLPSMPWRPSGALGIDTGRLSGTGTAVVNQGQTIAYAGTRLRFRARFSDSSQEVTLATNAAEDGLGGLRLALAASGELVLSEGQTSRAQASFDPLDTGVDWFVEATIDGASARVTVSSGSYGKESSTIATAETDALKETALGTRAALRLDSQVGIAPAVDEVAVARCGVAAPGYVTKLSDTFERPDSATEGNPEVPTGAAWSDAGETFEIVDGALQSDGSLDQVAVPLEVPLVGLRIRAAVQAVAGSGPFLWANVDFNVVATANGAVQGFWVWGGPNDGGFYTGLFAGGGELKHAGGPATVGVYYAQMDRDGDVAVITVREQSFDGPILGMQFAEGLKANPMPGGYLTLGDSGGDGTRFEELHVDVYPVQ